MPELPEVETVCRGLAHALEGRTLSAVEIRRPDLRIPFPPGFCRRLTGRRVESIGRRGKYILVRCDDGTVLIVHLGMSGRFVVFGGDEPGIGDGAHDHVIFRTAEGDIAVYSDPRRFGLMTLAHEAEITSHELLRDFGPEPLDAGFDGAALSRALAGKRTSIKAALLDQRVVAGVGNIYACEALHRARISPRRKAYTVAGRRAARLARSIRDVLTEAIAAGGSSLRDFARVDGSQGYFQHAFAVYGREAQPCPDCDCKDGIRRIVQGGRSTFYCPRRQR